MFQPLRDFYAQMVDRRYNVVQDVYAKMFAADFIAFLVIVFGYSSFGPSESTGGTHPLHPLPFFLPSTVLFLLSFEYRRCSGKIRGSPASFVSFIFVVFTFNIAHCAHNVLCISYVCYVVQLIMYQSAIS